MVPSAANHSNGPLLRQDDMKSRLAAKVLTYETERELMVDIALEKPNLKLSITPATRIYDLVGPRSFLMWDILGIGYDWLRKDIEHWESSQEYLEMRDYVRSVKVTNDAAERGVKVLFMDFFVRLQVYFFSCQIVNDNIFHFQMITDYAQILTKDEEMRSKLLQGVEKNRRDFPDFKKSTLTKYK